MSTDFERYLNARPLDVHTWSDHPEVNVFVDEIYSHLSSIKGNQRINKKLLKVVLLDLYVAWCTDPELMIMFSRDNNAYKAKSRYNEIHIGKKVIGVVDNLVTEGIIEEKRGFNDHIRGIGFQSRLWASSSLREKFKSARFHQFQFCDHEGRESIVLRDKKKEAVEDYIAETAKRRERDRLADVKTISGVFTGAYAEHPFTKEPVPIWIGDYVLASYGTGAVMAVPCGDQRDYDFAKHFNLEIPNIFEGADISESAQSDKSLKIANSDFLNGLNANEAIAKAISEIEARGLGKGKTNYRLRDAVFSRQRYWGEPFPVFYDNEVSTCVEDEFLPIPLPDVESYLPTKDGQPPLGNAKTWSWCKNKKIIKDNEKQNGVCTWPLELNTMPGWAGSSWYFLRYMDPNNKERFADKDKVDYWQNVDLYLGGSEHATGHLLYSRFWTKFLFDKGEIPFDEPFKKLINQGMILGRSSFVYRVQGTNKFVSFGLRKEYKTTRLHVDINMVDGDVLDTEAFKKWRPEYANAEFILEDGKYICGHEVEKMSKSKYNVQTPDDLVQQYGADTLRMYEMFLGPIEQAKPWDTKGINGVHGFLKKFWRLFHQGDNFNVSEEAASKDEMKTLHKCIKKVSEDIENFSFNTSVSAFMIAVNELTSAKCNKKDVLKDLCILLSPFAPHICEELWEKMGEKGSVTKATYPEFKAEYLVESAHTYPVSFNGKMRFKVEFPLDMDKDAISAAILEHENSQKYLDGKAPKKVIVVPKKIINVVV